jgi:type I restriction enzyme S subunit
MKVKFGDVVRDVKNNVDRSNNPYEFYVAGDHMDSEDFHINRRGAFATDDVGPAFVRIFNPGQVLYGSRRTYLKKVCVADFAGICANTTFVFETKNDDVFSQRLLPFIMLSDAFTDWSIKHSKGSTNPYVLFSDLADYEFDLPPMEEQKKLAELLWAANDLKEKYKKAITATDEMLKAKFREMFGDPQINEKRHEVVSVEEAVKLGYIEKPLDGNHGEKHPKASEYVQDGIPFVMANDIHDGIVDLRGCSFISEERALRLDKGFAKDGDVLLTHKGTIGHVALLRCDTSFIMLTPQVTYYRPIKKICAEFLRRYFESDWFQGYICRMAGSGSTRAYIGITKQLELPLMIPPLALQREFVAIAEKAEAAKTALKKSIADIDQVMKGLING